MPCSILYHLRTPSASRKCEYCSERLQKLVITGPLGHIGSHYIRALTPSQADEVLLLDNFLTQRYCSLFNLPRGVNYRFVETDITKANLRDLFAGADAVLHLAAITDAASSFTNKDQVEQVNYEGTVRVAEAAAQCAAKLIFISTTSVYGTQAALVDENCAASELVPQSPYAESKLRAERYLATLAATGGLRYSICRFGTIYGPSVGMRFHTAVNKFCWQAAMRLPLTVWRTALDQKRPYLDLSDATRALQFILESGHFDNQVYNVLTDNDTVRQIVDLIKAHLPALQVQLVDTQIMNQLSYEVANAKFRVLGCPSAENLADGIAATLALIQNAHSGVRP